MEPKGKKVVIKSSISNIKHGVIAVRAAVSPDGRFLVEGESRNPESEKRKALITVKDRITGLVHGKEISWRFYELNYIYSN